jgi:DNA-binding CsgD family transcriptional regulator
MISQSTAQDKADSFTTRERDILRLLDEGNSDHEIAQKLNLALSTVKWYNRQIYDKLGVKSRTQAIARAQRLGLLGDAAAPGPVLNLPAQTTGLVGRKHEISEARRLPFWQFLVG